MSHRKTRLLEPGTVGRIPCPPQKVPSWSEAPAVLNLWGTKRTNVSSVVKVADPDSILESHPIFTRFIAPGLSFRAEASRCGALGTMDWESRRLLVGFAGGGIPSGCPELVACCLLFSCYRFYKRPLCSELAIPFLGPGGCL